MDKFGSGFGPGWLVEVKSVGKSPDRVSQNGRKKDEAKIKRQKVKKTIDVIKQRKGREREREIEE